MGLLFSGCSKDDSRRFWENFWDKKRGTVPVSWSKRRILRVLASFDDPEGLDVLDAGCGTGFFSSYFISGGANVHCVDYSDKALSFAESVTSGNAKSYVKADILKKEELRALGKKFDIIFSDGLLEHYSPAEQDVILNNLADVKKKDGLMLNFVPNRNSLWSLVRPLIMDIREEPFKLKTFLGLHRKNGLRIISYGGLSVLPFRLSPENLGEKFGMLLYCVSK